jgi:hypothetical protein
MNVELNDMDRLHNGVTSGHRRRAFDNHWEKLTFSARWLLASRPATNLCLNWIWR